MTYEKYTISDTFETTLSSGIGASDTTVILNNASGLPSGSQKTILRLVQYTTPADPTTPISKSEYVLCTSRSGTVLTVTRGFDSSTQQTFSTSDYIYCINHTAVVEDVQDELTTLRTDVNNIDTFVEKSTATTKGDILARNSTEIVRLGVGTNGQVLKANSSTATGVEWGENVVPDATETSTGVVERATDTEALYKTDTTRYITPKHLGDAFTVVATDSLITSLVSFTVDESVGGSEKGREITIGASGVYRISFRIKGDTGSGSCSAQIKKNGVQVFSGSYDDSNDGIVYTTDQSFSIGDSLEIWGTVGGDDAEVSEIKISGTIIPYTIVL